jgi:hypothetical protein
VCDQLLCLKIYLSLLKNEGDLPCNLTDSQWLIVHDLHILLKPLMIAQKLMEGEAYVPCTKSGKDFSKQWIVPPNLDTSWVLQQK